MLVAVVVSLWGCDSQKEEAQPNKPVVVDPVDETPPQLDPSEKVVPANRNEEKPKKKQKLDLSIPEASIIQNDQAQDATEPALLPDMFDQVDSSTSVGGEFLRNEENEDYLDSIEGARVKVEITTD